MAMIFSLVMVINSNSNNNSNNNIIIAMKIIRINRIIISKIRANLNMSQTIRRHKEDKG